MSLGGQTNSQFSTTSAANYDVEDVKAIVPSPPWFYFKTCENTSIWASAHRADDALEKLKSENMRKRAVFYVYAIF